MDEDIAELLKILVFLAIVGAIAWGFMQIDIPSLLNRYVS